VGLKLTFVVNDAECRQTISLNHRPRHYGVNRPGIPGDSIF
jgi:hypothetical protein